MEGEKEKSFSLEDETDWLHISDDSIESNYRDTSNIYIDVDGNSSFEESYTFSSCGTFELRGLSQVAINRNGIQWRASKERNTQTKMNEEFNMEEKLIFIKTIGNGSCGVVMKALNIFESTVVAVKKISLTDKHKRSQLLH